MADATREFTWFFICLCLFLALLWLFYPVTVDVAAPPHSSSSLFPWGERVVAACGESADGVLPPASSAEDDGLPVTNGTPRRPAAVGKVEYVPDAVARTAVVSQPDPDITIVKCESAWHGQLENTAQ